MFRFSIRDLLWLTAVVALVIGYWAERTKAKNAAVQRTEAQERTEFYLGIVVRLQKEKYRLQSDILRMELVTSKRKPAANITPNDNYEISPKTLEELLPRFPAMPGEVPTREANGCP